ncbi:PHP domain-containing protein [Streptomyces sp. TRM66268-LWL]|uniref:PHP domain-containing protein n=1 Tax=Streptomyces polyasparticus TaxID=2767826 RepID=A0ABR7STN3_9ACTN|nr:PHP domain-containing protein [Streptomyces polyasparticus]
MAGVTHLHAASGFSARYGASHPEALVRRATELDMGTLTLTDRDTVAGAVRFAKACAKYGVRPVFGVELAVAAHAPEEVAKRRTPVRGGAHVAEPPLRITLLAKNMPGWARRLDADGLAQAVREQAARAASRWSGAYLG